MQTASKGTGEQCSTKKSDITNGRNERHEHEGIIFGGGISIGSPSAFLVDANPNATFVRSPGYGLPKRLGSKCKLIGSHSMVKGHFGHHFASSSTLCSWLS
jgi:hypothetical protein